VRGDWPPWCWEFFSGSPFWLSGGGSAFCERQRECRGWIGRGREQWDCRLCRWFIRECQLWTGEDAAGFSGGGLTLRRRGMRGDLALGDFFSLGEEAKNDGEDDD